MISVKDKNEERKVRHARVRKHIFGTAARPRLCVYKSLKSIYAQVIDDERGATIVSASTLDKDLASSLEGKTKSEQAKVVGEAIAKKAIAAKIKEVVFDRGGYLFTGRVAALAEGARSAGLKF